MTRFRKIQMVGIFEGNERPLTDNDTVVSEDLEDYIKEYLTGDGEYEIVFDSEKLKIAKREKDNSVRILRLVA